ncbi:MAG: putative copper resistance protein [Frankiales bacterium]|nr:putative copper resistance protein [Frankiales bacterium]
MGLDPAVMLTDWQTGAVAATGLALELLSAAAYLVGVALMRRRQRAWPVDRTVTFLLGLTSIAVVLQSGLAAYDTRLLWVHMTQHLVLMMLAPPLLAWGSPVRLCLAVGSPAVRRWVAGLLRTQWVRRLTGGRHAARRLTLDYYVTMAVYLLTPLYALSEQSTAFHEVVHAYFFACGLLFWVPVLGHDPAEWRPTCRTKVLLVAAGVPVSLVLGACMWAQGRSLSPTHSVADLHRGILTLSLGGMLLSALGVIVLVGQHRHRGLPAARRRAHAVPDPTPALL